MYSFWKVALMIITLKLCSIGAKNSLAIISLYICTFFTNNGLLTRTAADLNWKRDIFISEGYLGWIELELKWNLVCNPLWGSLVSQTILQVKHTQAPSLIGYSHFEWVVFKGRTESPLDYSISMISLLTLLTDIRLTSIIWSYIDIFYIMVQHIASLSLDTIIM